MVCAVLLCFLDLDGKMKELELKIDSKNELPTKVEGILSITVNFNVSIFQGQGKER